VVTPLERDAMSVHRRTDADRQAERNTEPTPLFKETVEAKARREAHERMVAAYRADVGEPGRRPSTGWRMLALLLVAVAVAALLLIGSMKLAAASTTATALPMTGRDLAGAAVAVAVLLLVWGAAALYTRRMGGRR
jgi:hypothetical protein